MPTITVIKPFKAQFERGKPRRDFPVGEHTLTAVERKNWFIQACLDEGRAVEGSASKAAEDAAAKAAEEAAAAKAAEEAAAKAAEEAAAAKAAEEAAKTGDKPKDE